MIYAQEERRQWWIDMALITIACSIMLGMLIGGIWLLAWERDMWGPMWFWPD